MAESEDRQMKQEHRLKSVPPARKVSEEGAQVAAFFDLDGTLSPKPSLEKRFFLMLRHRHLIGARNCYWWLGEAIRLAPWGISQIMHANKMYLRGVRMDEAILGAGSSFPPFFPEAIERAAWHAERGDSIVIVSGTLEPLALLAARALEAELGSRGRACRIQCMRHAAGREKRTMVGPDCGRGTARRSESESHPANCGGNGFESRAMLRVRRQHERSGGCLKRRENRQR